MSAFKNISKKRIIILVFFPILFYFSQGCRTSKNNVFNRFYHSTATKFNIIFNGQQAYQKAMDSLDKNIRYDYQRRLPFETIQDGKIDKRSLFFSALDFAEEKAVKAIQKHSMFIAGEERNSQIDEAYLLLGKCRYHTKRLSPALESFLEITQKDTDADKTREALIWQAKTEIALGDYYTAFSTLQYFIKYPNNDTYRSEAYELIAQSELLQGDINTAIHTLKTAINLSKNQKKQLFKRRILLGQLHEQMGNINTAQHIFKTIATDENPPYPFDVFATLCWAKIAKKKHGKLVFATLKKYRRKQKYRLYFADVFFEMGQILLREKKTEKAMKYYQKASVFTKNKDVKTKVMKALAQYHLEQRNYKKTDKYYDTIINMSQGQNNIVKFKKEWLSKLIKTETTVQKNDSILEVLSLSEKERKKFYREKAYAKITAQKNETTAQKIIASRWYFDNKARVLAGKTAFLEKWGDIKLTDDWKWKKIQSTAQNPSITAAKTNQNHVENMVKKQLIAIKKLEKSTDSIRAQHLQQLFQLGLLYKEVFKDRKKAVERFESVIYIPQIPPSLKSGSYYHLYQMLQKVNPEKAKRYKNKLLSEFPNHMLSQSLSEKNKANTTAFKTIELAYHQAFSLYRRNFSQEALKAVDQIIIKGKTMLTGKVLLLKSIILIKLGDKKQGKQLLEFVQMNYGHQSEGVRAGILLQKLTKKANEAQNNVS